MKLAACKINKQNVQRDPYLVPASCSILDVFSVPTPQLRTGHIVGIQSMLADSVPLRSLGHISNLSFSDSGKH